MYEFVISTLTVREFSLLNAETAHQSNRAYVFEEFAWDVRHCLATYSFQQLISTHSLPITHGSRPRVDQPLH
jgi:hypothetical protein